MLDWLGWFATAVFVTSYFTKQSATLRRIQGVAACLWAVYGVLIHALPVVVANVIVAGVALASSFKRRVKAEASGS
ncbi:MAG: YgjV family protein [Gemmatimonadales bacterium]